MTIVSAPPVGSIVGCWFPYDSNPPPNPGPDFRPCLILQVISRIDKASLDMLVCYGTGQTSDCNKLTMNTYSIEVESGVSNNLPETTKFNLKKVAILPFEPRFFTPKGQRVPYSRFGKLTPAQTDLVVDILAKAGVSANYSSHKNVCIVNVNKKSDT